MKETRPQDALAVLAMAAVAAVLVIVRSAGGWLHGLVGAPASLLDLVLAHPLAVVALVLAGSSMAAARLMLTRRTLRSRVRLQVLPSETFDPTPEAVVRFVSQLARLRPVVGGWLDPRARALRVLIESDPAGRLRYVLEVPSQAQALLRTALGAYDQIDLRAPDDTPDTEPPPARGHVVRAELVLARPSSEPLAMLGADPDPLQGFAAALGRLRPELGDAAQVAVDVLPCSPARRRRLRARLLKQARREQTRSAEAGPGLGELLGARRPGRQKATAVELLERRGEVRGLQGKLGTGEPLLELQVLVRLPLRDARPTGGAASGAVGLL